MDRYDNNTYLDDEELSQLQHQQHPQQQTHHQPSQTIVDEAELLAAQAAAEAAAAAQQQQPGGAFSNVGQGLTGKHRDMMMQYWQETINSIEHDDHDFKNHQLPLARIKKVMKTDEDVRMISAEAPILFAKGCDVFITELTMRAWIHAEENKRRTLQKSDIAAALTKSDMFDFLIDVVPREEEKPKKSYSSSRSNSYINQHQNPIPGSISLVNDPRSSVIPEHEVIKSEKEDEPLLKTENDDMLQQQLLQEQILQQRILQSQQSQPQQSQPQVQQPSIQQNNGQTEATVSSEQVPNESNGRSETFQNFQDFAPGYQGNY